MTHCRQEVGRLRRPRRLAGQATAWANPNLTHTGAWPAAGRGNFGVCFHVPNSGGQKWGIRLPQMEGGSGEGLYFNYYYSLVSFDWGSGEATHEPPMLSSDRRRSHEAQFGYRRTFGACWGHWAQEAIAHEWELLAFS